MEGVRRTQQTLGLNVGLSPQGITVGETALGKRRF
jgi:hypothetical protein